MKEIVMVRHSEGEYTVTAYDGSDDEGELVASEVSANVAFAMALLHADQIYARVTLYPGAIQDLAANLREEGESILRGMGGSTCA